MGEPLEKFTSRYRDALRRAGTRRNVQVVHMTSVMHSGRCRTEMRWGLNQVSASGPPTSSKQFPSETCFTSTRHGVSGLCAEEPDYSRDDVAVDPQEYRLVYWLGGDDDQGFRRAPRPDQPKCTSARPLGGSTYRRIARWLRATPAYGIVRSGVSWGGPRVLG